LRRRKSREGLIISTKGAHPRLDSMDRPRMSKAEVQADLDSSLKRLGIDCVDIYWLHRDDRGTPVADILLMLDDFRRAGKIRYAGFSNWTLARAEAARVAAEELNIQGFIASQNQWSLARADAAKGDPTWAYVDEPFIAWHQQYQFVAFPYTPQANGYFRRLESGTLPEAPALVRALFHSPTNERRYDRIREIRAKSGYRTGDIVLAYLLNQPFPVFPIIGPRKLPDLEESVKAADLILTPDQLQFLVAP
jgi:aryl-alcohol dehydrogenase-like predicted oxidoreductase